MKKILVISVHPDDETLGCGGTLLKHIACGDKIDWLIVTSMREENEYSSSQITERNHEIKAVVQKYNIKKVHQLNFAAGKLNTTMSFELISKISKVIIESQPEVLYLPNRSDVHSDHRITFDAVISCTKSFRNPAIKRILMYECISETEFAPALTERAFIPNYFVDISPHLKEKLSIFEIYKSEIGEHPFPRSLRNIEALATFRGACIGVEYAEAFHLIKFIDK